MNASSVSWIVSPNTLTVMTFEVSPAAKFTVPEGRNPSAKSAPVTAAPETDQSAVLAEARSPLRVTVKVKGVVPDWPSAMSAEVAATDRLMSSLRIVALAAAVPIVAPALGFDRVTVNPSSASSVVSPTTFTVTSLEVSPAANVRIPEGRTPPSKSAALACEELTAQLTLWDAVVSPLRVTVKVKGVVPDWPSAVSATVAAIDRLASSLRIVPVARAVANVMSSVGSDRVTAKDSFPSTTVSPATLTVMTFVVSPGAKATVPVGKAPPVKSAPLTAEPDTTQFAFCVHSVSPVRVTVNVKPVLPEWPSALLALVAAIDTLTSSLKMVPVAVLAAIAVPAEGFERVTLKVSFASIAVSRFTTTSMNPKRLPAGIVRVPVAVV